MNLYKAILLLLIVSASFTSRAQIGEDYYVEKYETVKKEQVVQYLLQNWRGQIPDDTLLKIFVRECYPMEYHSAKRKPNEIYENSPIHHISEISANYGAKCGSNPIACSWTSFDTTNGNFYLSAKNEKVTVYTNKFIESQRKYVVQVYYTYNLIFPLRLKMDVQKGKDLIKKRTYKNTQGKWVTNKNLYFVYIYTLNGVDSKVDSNTILCPIEKIEVWDSKEKKAFLGEIQFDKKNIEIVFQRDYGDRTAPQEDVIEGPVESAGPFEEKEVDTPASYPNLLKYLKDEVEYPNYEKDAGIEGNVYIRFVVELDGSLSHIYVVKGVSKGMDDEAIRLFKKISGKNKWKPAILKNKPVRQEVVYRVPFKLAE